MVHPPPRELVQWRQAARRILVLPAPNQGGMIGGLAAREMPGRAGQYIIMSIGSAVDSMESTRMTGKSSPFSSV